MKSRSNLTTEKRNPSSELIDLKSTEEILHIINSEDETVAHAVKKAIPQICKTISFCVSAIKNGNRIIYVGAGTSGRLGVLDASEISPTFSAPSEWFTGVIAGGPVRAIMEQIGIVNILSKNTGSTNAINVVKAVEHGLKQLRDPLIVARQRGISLKELFN